MNKRVISICADDIGQDPAINEGCLELFQLKRLNAVSALVEAPYISEHRNAWQTARSQGLEIGLHFNLTLKFDDSTFCKALSSWILLSQLRLINTDSIRESFIKQLDLFTHHFGHLPDFIDGHQHIHQFPMIRDVLVNEVQKRFSTPESFWVRNTVPPENSTLPDSLKCQLLTWLGGQALKSELDKRKIRSNDGFLGVYGFNANDSEAYRMRIRQWLKHSNNGALLMCHPANSAVLNDAIGKQRPIEFSYLKSDLFIQDLNEFNVALVN